MSPRRERRAQLALSAEVKQLDLELDALPGIKNFANETGRRGALGVIAALGFRTGMREKLQGMGPKLLDTASMLKIVEL